MPELFGIDIAGLISDSMAGNLPDGVLTQKGAEGELDENNISAGRSRGSPTTHSFEGFYEDFETKDIDGTQVTEQHRKCVLIAGSIKPTTVPKSGDTITLEGVESPIVRVLGRDPAAATYIVQVQKG